MDRIAELDLLYEQFTSRLSELLPDGIVQVDLKLLQKLSLLKEDLQYASSPSLTRFFHVVESKDKITLYNDQFVIWIVPDKESEESKTLVLIALESHGKLRLEMGFTITGIYNTSRLVLRTLEKFLSEIQENEDFISQLEEK